MVIYNLSLCFNDNFTVFNILLFKMTVVQSIVGGKMLQFPASLENSLPTFGSLSPTVTSRVLEGIAQNTSGSVFKAEVKSQSGLLLLLH
jgi:hypothetical protein